MNNSMYNNMNLTSVLRYRPQAIAVLRGSEQYLGIYGNVRFYRVGIGVMVAAQVSGLPSYNDRCQNPVFGFHIHEGESCTGNIDDPFADAGTHYNPYDCPHPYHAGDMPPLFAADGTAFSAFLTNRFSLREIIGKTVIIHSMPDDFRTQPGGNSGEKIACGKIVVL